ncbi:putative Nitroreductase [Elusimicrobium minutum Pei191]|uniref:Putative Nitroreductase n=1 Tax=Elusimicrobium minutum (strain Pei191) TaxID=445932 RepID=B2KCK3_ELUMP|nr:nitroreductase [Elusimicrobium minutum]ACC98249.1 putative Nitroreductase [Elusimicrobium minutum Pei191]
MNEIIKTLLSRRSVRAYKNTQISDEKLQMILEAGRFAPSAMNLQPWHFLVIQNKAALDEFSKDVKDVMIASDFENAKKEGFNFFYNAPTVIFICGEETSSFAEMDCTMAASNMITAATLLGLQSCFIVSFKVLFKTPYHEKYAVKFGLPKGYMPMCAVVLGHAADGETLKIPHKKTEIVTLIK